MWTDGGAWGLGCSNAFPWHIGNLMGGFQVGKFPLEEEKTFHTKHSQGFLALCLMAPFHKIHLPSICQMPFEFKNFLCFTLGKSFLPRASFNFWGYMPFGYCPHGYNPQIRGGTRQQAFSYALSWWAYIARVKPLGAGFIGMRAPEWSQGCPPFW